MRTGYKSSRHSAKILLGASFSLIIRFCAGTFGDFFSVTHPAAFTWPADRADYLEIYDWDQIILEQPANLSLKLDLCLGIFPCAININGQGPAPILAITTGYISCLASAGCSMVQLDSVSIACSSAVGANPVLTLQGAFLALYNVNISGCSSVTNGGFIFSYDMATVLMSACLFQNMHTLGYGSVLMAAGSEVTIEESVFINCSSDSGGGALWATVYICTGSQYMAQTNVHINSSSFISCSSPGSGGSILVTSDASISNKVFVAIQSSIFQQCSAGSLGGAVLVTGQLATVNVQSSTFVECYAAVGGAFAVEELGRARIFQSSFVANKAAGLGGGAIYSNDADTVLVGLACEANLAPAGGGGAILWDSTEPPIIAVWCSEGSWGQPYPDMTAQPCIKCAAGTYQSGVGMLGKVSCSACPAGTYSETFGMSSCSSCPAGKFATGIGANNSGTCTDCAIGNFSLSPATSCLVCAPGTFSNITGASACFQCPTVATARPLWCNGVVTLREFDRPPTSVESSSWTSWKSERIGRPRILKKESARRGKSHPETTSSESTNVACGVQWTRNGIHPKRRGVRPSIYRSSKRALEAQLSASGSSGWCGSKNNAAYGKCIASAYKWLDVVAPSIPIYPGIPFSIVVHKMDAYNQTISTDSDSVLQVYPSSSSGSSHLTLLGPIIVRMQAGVAEFTIDVKPAFVRVDAQLGLAVPSGAPTIFFQGLDSSEVDASSTMTSPDYAIDMRSGDQVCPPGYVLKLDSPVGSARSGVCSFCSEGTYSINPLFGGSNTSNPSCVPCPLQALQNGDCAHGGGDVNFTLGTWEVSDGVYKLVGCPAGYQLINSVDGLFSNQIQQCSRCGASEYILDSSNASYSCQPCPDFLICDGTRISSRYSGARIIINYAAGLYQLSGCPAGFEIGSDKQDCTICPPLYYCTGGSAGSLQCPPNTFSSTGTNSSSFCLPSVFVNLVVLLPISVEDFGAADQARFATAVAAATRTAVDRVIILSVTAASTRRASGVDVQAKLAASDSGQASSMVLGLDPAALNDALTANGLPEGQIQEVRIGDGTTVVVTGLSAAGVAGVAASVACFALLLAGGLAAWVRFRKSEAEDERLLRLEVAALRRRLGLRNRDGFYLSYEAGPLWRRRDRSVFILRNEMEAAARLSLLLEFDVKSFDAFCHCLEYSNFVLRRGEAGGGRDGAAPPQYEALCEWLLETCRGLIEPAILRRRRVEGGRAPSEGGDGEADLEADPGDDDLGEARRRFVYFKRRVALARVWVNHDRLLWRRLKGVAAEYMDEIAPICDTRCGAPPPRRPPTRPSGCEPAGGPARTRPARKMSVQARKMRAQPRLIRAQASKVRTQSRKLREEAREIRERARKIRMHARKVRT